MSVYKVEADIADGLTTILRMAGWPRANRSLVIREALLRLHEDLADKRPDDVVQYFIDRQSRRLRAAATPSDSSPAERLSTIAEITSLETRSVTRNGEILPMAGSLADAIHVHCGRCGRAMVVRCEDLLGRWTIECAQCIDGARTLTNSNERGRAT